MAVISVWSQLRVLADSCQPSVKLYWCCLSPSSLNILLAQDESSFLSNSQQRLSWLPPDTAVKQKRNLSEKDERAQLLSVRYLYSRDRLFSQIQCSLGWSITARRNLHSQESFLFSPTLMPTTHAFYVSLLYNLEICSTSNTQQGSHSQVAAAEPQPLPTPDNGSETQWLDIKPEIKHFFSTAHTASSRVRILTDRNWLLWWEDQ